MFKQGFMILLILLLLSACQGPNSVFTSKIEVSKPEENAQPIQQGFEPYVFKTSEPNMITLKGVLIVLDPLSFLPDPNDGIFLVPLVGAENLSTIPPFKVGEVPQAEVNEVTGDFVFTNIQPGKYAVVVLTVGASQIPARYYQSGDYALIILEEDARGKVIDLGDLSL